MLFGQEMHYYMVYIAHFTELILKICDYAENDAFDPKIVNMRLTKIVIAIFAPDERLPSSATLLLFDRNLRKSKEIILKGWCLVARLSHSGQTKVRKWDNLGAAAISGAHTTNVISLVHTPVQYLVHTPVQ